MRHVRLYFIAVPSANANRLDSPVCSLHTKQEIIGDRETYPYGILSFKHKRPCALDERLGRDTCDPISPRQTIPDASHPFQQAFALTSPLASQEARLRLNSEAFEAVGLAKSHLAGSCETPKKKSFLSVLDSYNWTKTGDALLCHLLQCLAMACPVMKESKF